jgi:hypothetical protein
LVSIDVRASNGATAPPSSETKIDVDEPLVIAGKLDPVIVTYDPSLKAAENQGATVMEAVVDFTVPLAMTGGAVTAPTPAPAADARMVCVPARKDGIAKVAMNIPVPAVNCRCVVPTVSPSNVKLNDAAVAVLAKPLPTIVTVVPTAAEEGATTLMVGAPVFVKAAVPTVAGFVAVIV